MEHSSSLAIPDDSQEWHGVILDDQQVSGHTSAWLKGTRCPFKEYVIKISYLNHELMCDSTEALETIEPISWTVRKRYNDFSALNKAIRSEAEDVGEIVLPGKKFTGNLSRDFILERKRGLQSFVDGVLGHPMLRTSVTVRQFFSPEVYAQDFAEAALQNVFLSFRNSVRYETVGELKRIGWRPQKTYFQVRDKENPKSELLLSWCGYGTSKMSSAYTDKVRQSIARSLTQLQHPHLATLESCEFSSAGGFFIRRMMPRGSVRDAIAHAKPRETFLRKYCNGGGGRRGASPVALGDLRLWSWQALVGLKFLHDRGLAHGSLSASNVLLSESGSAQITDFENFLLGLPHGGISRTDAVSRLRAPSSSLANFDLYSFGHVLYEMATGRPANSAVVDVIPQGVPEDVGAVILSLLSTWSTKSSPQDYPTFESILADSFYERLQREQATALAQSVHSKPYLKFSSATKESIAEIFGAAEERLRMDYRVLRAHEKDLRRRDILKSGRMSARKKVEAPSRESGMGPKTMPVAISTSSTTSSIPSSVASTPPPLPPQEPMPPSNGATFSSNQGRTALLGSIGSFEKSRLRKAKTVDKSSPRV